ncbi:MAG TPA: ATP-binding protein [Terriglobales bacterium]|nr:ATP-binding protein [Terriglobales bacterium]
MSNRFAGAGGETVTNSDRPKRAAKNRDIREANDTMLSADVIRQQLHQGAETKNLDYKQGFDWNTCSPDTRLGVVKDVLGMSNTQDGGVILIGIDDDSFRISGATAEQAESFDQTRLADAIRRYSDPPCPVQLYKLEIETKKIIAIEVPEFKDVPHLCKADGNSSTSGKIILRRGALYVRTDRATTEEVGLAEEMRALLGRALKARGDSIISSIRALLAGTPPPENSPNEYDRQISETADFFKTLDFARDEGKWILTSHPISFERDWIGDPREIVTRLEGSKVSLRGWSSPA